MVAIPLFVMAPLSGLTAMPTLIASTSNIAITQSSPITQKEDIDRQNTADILDNFFASYEAPLEGYGMKFVTEAEKNGIDWRLLPAIAMRESTGGKNGCKKVANSVFGYGSCRLSFKSIDESIEIISQSLGGNNPATAHHYAGKTTVEILKKYNPDSIVPGYSKQVVKIMKMIDDSEDIL